MRGFLPVGNIAMVQQYFNRHAGYKQLYSTHTRRNLTNTHNAWCCIQFRIWYCLHSHPSQWCWHLRIPIPKLQPCAIIKNPQPTRATESNLRQMEWELQPQGVSTPRSMVFSSRSIHQFGHWDMTRHLTVLGRLLELIMWNRWPLTSGSDLEMLSYAM